MDKFSTINHFRPTSLSPGQYLQVDIALGRVPYQVTPCPATGGHHTPEISEESQAGGGWVEMTCEKCAWVSQGVIYTKNEQQQEQLRQTNPDYFDDVPASDVTIHPDDEYNRDLVTEQYYTSGTVYCWHDPYTDDFHTHDRLPVIDPKEPDWPLWLVD